MLRGISIVLVVLYHALYNLSEVFGGRYAFFRSEGMSTFRDCFVAVLMILSGISCYLSRSNLKRGLKTLACGMIITAATYIAMPAQFISFGILHFFGVCMLIFAACRKIFDRIPVWPGAAASLILYFLTKNIFFSVRGLPHSFLLYILGFNTGFSSADYYPLLPWMFLFFIGCFLGRYFGEGRVPEIFTADPVKPLSFIGRHTMIIYLVHQPVIYGVMWPWFNL